MSGWDKLTVARVVASCLQPVSPSDHGKKKLRIISQLTADLMRVLFALRTCSLMTHT